jgi:hypothetical protein
MIIIIIYLKTKKLKPIVGGALAVHYGLSASTLAEELLRGQSRRGIAEQRAAEITLLFSPWIAVSIPDQRRNHGSYT